MKALIFSAGLGTRLYPFTKNKPKALVELNGKPLLWHAISNLKNFGVTQVIINIHHFAQQIIDYVNTEHFGLTIEFSDERDELLETGGGLLKVSALLKKEEFFIACNVDVISTLNIGETIKYHLKEKPLATLVVRKRETSRYLLFDDELQLNGWQNLKTKETKLARQITQQPIQLAFSGIQIISGEIFDLIEEQGKFSIIDLYLRLAQKHKIVGFIDESSFWLDLGKPEQLDKATQMLKSIK